MDPFDKDSEARKRFDTRVGGIIHELLAEEVEGFVKSVSGRVLNSLTDELLSFTMEGQQYLCLNIVCSPIPSTNNTVTDSNADG